MAIPGTMLNHGRTCSATQSAFELASAYPSIPAGDQPTAIEGLVEWSSRRSGASRFLLGVTGSGKTFTMANVIERIQRPAIVLAPNKTLAAQLYGEMREFFPGNAVEYFVSYYDYYQPEAYVPARTPTLRKTHRSMSTLSRCAVGHQGADRAQRRCHRRDRFGHLRAGRPGSVFQRWCCTSTRGETH